MCGGFYIATPADEERTPANIALKYLMDLAITDARGTGYDC